MSRAIATDAAKMRAAAHTSLLAVLAAVSGTASADILPGDYAPYSTGTRIVGLHYKYASGGELRAGGDLVDENFDAVDQQGVLTFNYYGGQRLRWLANASLPFGRTEIDSDLLRLHDTSTGIGDPYFVVGVVPVIRDKYSIGVSGWLFVHRRDDRGRAEPGRDIRRWPHGPGADPDPDRRRGPHGRSALQRKGTARQPTVGGLPT